MGQDMLSLRGRVRDSEHLNRRKDIIRIFSVEFDVQRSDGGCTVLVDW